MLFIKLRDSIKVNIFLKLAGGAYNNEKKTDFMDVHDLTFGRQLSDACAKYSLGGLKKACIE